MTSLLFAHNGQGTSTWIGTSQLSQALVSGHQLLYTDDNCQNRIIIAVKTASRKLNLSKLVSKGNRIILDLLDWVDYDKYKLSANCNAPNFFPDFETAHFSGYIVNSQRQLQWFREHIDSSKPIFVMPRHWDNRFSEIELIDKPEKPHIYFSGQTSRKNENCLYLRELLSSALIHDNRSSDRYFDLLPKNGCQISIRREGSFEYCFKPATKLISSSAIGNPIITTSDWAVTELLDSDYPYLLTDSNYSTVKSFIEFVKATFEGPEWRLAKEILAELKNRTRVEAVAKKYLEIERYFS